MSVHEEIATRSGLKLKVEKTEANDQVQVCLRTEAGQKPLLHWGLRNHGEAA
jgi:hypothetical protein